MKNIKYQGQRLKFNNLFISKKTNQSEIIFVGGEMLSAESYAAPGVISLDLNGDFDDSLNFGGGVGIWTRSIYTFNSDSNNNIYIGGDFTEFDYLPYNRFVKCDSGGTIDSSFMDNLGTGFSSVVNSTFIDSLNGKIYVAGSFGSVNGTPRSRIARLNTDGTLDDSFIPLTFSNNTVHSINLQSDGKLLVGGQFTTYGGVSRTRLIRILTDSSGTFDATFNVNGDVLKILIQTNDKIIACGSFTGTGFNRLVRLNTDFTRDTNFNIGTGFNGTVTDIIFDGEKIVVVGVFSTFNGVTVNGIVRLNSDGTMDTSFNMGSGFSANTYLGVTPYASSITILNNGKYLVIGNFLTYNSFLVNTACIINTDGTLDETFNPGGGIVLMNASNATRITNIHKSSRNIFIGGGFGTYIRAYGGKKLYSLSKITNGKIDNNFTGIIEKGRVVYSTCSQIDGKVIIYSNSPTYNGTNSKGLFRVNTDGSLDESFDAGTSFTDKSYDYVTNILVQPDGKIIIGGYFTNFGPNQKNYLIRLNSDGSEDTNFTAYTDPLNTYIVKIILDDNGKIIYCGNRSVVKLNSDGTRDISFESIDTDGDILCMTKTENGNIGIGGWFWINNDISYAALLDGITGEILTTFETGSDSFSDNVTSVVAQGNKLIFSGWFKKYRGITVNYIVRVNENGTFDETFNSGLGGNYDIQVINIDDMGRIYIGGTFSSFDRGKRSGFARLNPDGSLDESFNCNLPGSGFNIYSISV